MLFNSYVFLLVFLPIVLSIWWGLGLYPRLRLAFLTVASFVFYGWWHWEFTLLLLASAVVDYWVGIGLWRTETLWKRRSLLCVSLVANLGMLGYFKYSGFLAESINGLMEALRYGSPIHVPDILLPAGISFYTFQTLTYSVDLYKREVSPAKSFFHFAAYVSMFPQLIAGPIVRYSDVEKQFQCMPVFPSWDQLSRAIWFFTIGMSQKIIVADTVARLAAPRLVSIETQQFFSSWNALIGYTVQLYFDFAGYSNMAIGLGLMLGFEFPKNFDSPYKAHSIQNFWRRWHITLSSFLRDYLYIPLGGNRGGIIAGCRNLFLVMLLGGVWHGAGWTFILWGVYHGILLAIHMLYRHSFEGWKVPRWVGVPTTLLTVMFGWVLFRSESLDQASGWLLGLIGFRGIESSWFQLVTSSGFGFPFACLIACLLLPNASEVRPRWNQWTAVALACLLVYCLLQLDSESPFLYFQF